MKAKQGKYVIFRDKHPLVGPIFWTLSVQYFITQYIVAAAWATHFSLRQNVISDLGNTACGQYGAHVVCSPEHNLMNASFIVLGITMMLGAITIHSEFRQKRLARLGFVLMGLAGLGTLVVGIFPENTLGVIHASGAALPFLLGNIALVLFGYSLNLPPGFRWFTRVMGVEALVALAFYVTNHFGPFGRGGLERVVAYPQTIWLIFFGLYMSANHYRKRRGGYS